MPLRRFLVDHQVSIAYEQGWSSVGNGDLRRLAELEGFELLITTDTNLRYQQNLTERIIAILVLTTTSWPRIRNATAMIATASDSIQPGIYQEIPIP